MQKRIPTALGIIILVIFAMATASVMFWFLYSHKQPTYAATQQTKIPGWKTYTDVRYGFTVEYPSDWHYVSADIANANAVVVFCPATDQSCDSTAGVYMVVYNQQTGSQVLDSYRQQGGGYKEQNMLLNGYPAVGLQESYCNGVPLITNGIFATKGDYTYQLEGPMWPCGTKIVEEDYNNQQSIFNQIASTFTFAK
jgi:hypothetical protein